MPNTFSIRDASRVNGRCDRCAVDRLERERDEVAGVVVTSAKRTFLVGADLRELRAVTRERAADFLAANLAVKRTLRRLETLGRPVVAALNGSALGGGYELALACHHRIALDTPESRIGLPEVTLGLLPGGGGVTRTVRLLGLAGALPDVLLAGRRHTARAALAAGLVDELADDPEELLTRARAFVRANPDARQPWDAKGHRIPGGTPGDRALAPQLIALPAQLEQRLGGAPFPAPRAVLAAAVEGAQVDLETALVVEGRHFTELVTGQTARNMIQGYFFDLRAVTSAGGAARPANPGRIGVLGAGETAATLTRACADAGLDVVAATEAAELAGCDLVVEAAADDDLAHKHKVLQEIEDVLAPDAPLCTTTATLPLAAIAEGVRHRDRLVGLRLLPAAEPMPLVEIARGPASGEATLARARALATALGAAPLVVNGDYTLRLTGRYLDEGAAMVGAGIAPATVEQAAAQAGFGTGPLALLDELSLPLARRIRRTAGRPRPPHPGDAVIDRMIDAFDRPGRAAGAGFYDHPKDPDHPDGRRAGLWPGLREHFAHAGAAPTTPPSATNLPELGERLLFAVALDAVRCLDEGVLGSVAEANVGSLLGVGFPGWTGGVLQFADGHPGGLPGFAARAGELREAHGERFAPPPLLAAKAARGETFADG
ncbi:enoyl-CoA hydratase-related protein [Streptomyces hainanensis]|uniref:enoyl-CoA hydratase-related protein n=1 Tax=Streptomyces hainanensis TaxID=402648 RepID=UPI001FB5B0DE|nr:enoyl-CoA hydratase-related protein [Streptomyces hainanensis]